MDKNGKKFDVLIEDNIGEDPQTGLKKFFGFVVWADAGMKNIIADIPGIHRVSDFDTVYYIYLDPRYDREFLRAEIEARIKIKEANE